MACAIKNGNKDSPVDISGDVLKIVVIGEPRCGKTTFIRGCVRDNYPGPETSINGVRVYPCEFEVEGDQRSIVLYEIPGHPDFLLQQRRPHYEKADIFVFMYAIDDPSSLEMLYSKWKPETNDIISINVIPVVVVGNKEDLRNNQQVIERLALNNQVPVRSEQTTELFGPNVVPEEISSNNLDQVLQTFTNICSQIFGFSMI